MDVDEGQSVQVSFCLLICTFQLESSSATAVLGRFLHSLNKYCLETHGLNFDICDYSDYNFHQVLSYTLRYDAVELSFMFCCFLTAELFCSKCRYGVVLGRKQIMLCMSSSSHPTLLLVFCQCQVCLVAMLCCDSEPL